MVGTFGSDNDFGRGGGTTTPPPPLGAPPPTPTLAGKLGMTGDSTLILSPIADTGVGTRGYVAAENPWLRGGAGGKYEPEQDIPGKWGCVKNVCGVVKETGEAEAETGVESVVAPVGLESVCGLRWGEGSGEVESDGVGRWEAGPVGCWVAWGDVSTSMYSSSSSSASSSSSPSVVCSLFSPSRAELPFNCTSFSRIQVSTSFTAAPIRGAQMATTSGRGWGVSARRTWSLAMRAFVRDGNTANIERVRDHCVR